MATANQPQLNIVQVDVIIPVHNASETVEETVKSALHQIIPNEFINSESALETYELRINVCCYDDASTDASWDILKKLQIQYGQYSSNNNGNNQSGTEGKGANIAAKLPRIIPSRLLIGQSSEGVGRGAGYARNRAAELSLSTESKGKDISSSYHDEQFLCLLDSDDVMHPTRVAEQVHGMLSLSQEERKRTLMGCQVIRDPPDSTWHYTAWANGLSNERLLLERFREVTLLQPTWMMCRSRFNYLGGYIEAPKPQQEASARLEPSTEIESMPTAPKQNILQLIHPTFDTPQTLRLAEDLRYFHAHLYANGLLRLHKSSINPEKPLVTYRHRLNQSQSYQTSWKLLLHLQALAFEICVLRDSPINSLTTIANTWRANDGKFVVWGAGRDGKDFVRALSLEARERVYCFVDVDQKKIQQGFYANRELGLKIPIVHFSLLAKDPEIRKQLLEDNTTFGEINKSKDADTVAHGDNRPEKKKQKIGKKIIAATLQVTKSKDLSILPALPVVICVAMYRTNGALEKNVASVGRVEGDDLWHFS